MEPPVIAEEIVAALRAEQVAAGRAVVGATSAAAMVAMLTALPQQIDLLAERVGKVLAGTRTLRSF